MIQLGMMTLVHHSLILKIASQCCQLKKFAKSLCMDTYFKFSTCKFYFFGSLTTLLVSSASLSLSWWPLQRKEHSGNS